MTKSIFLLLFLLTSILYLLSATYNWPIVPIITKPLIVLSLIAYYLQSTKDRSGIFILALTACCLGDTFLLFEPVAEIYFLLGLGSFLIGHLLFILSYRYHRGEESPEGSTQKLRLAFPVILAGTGLAVILYPKLGGLRLPVMIYAIVLTTMVVTSVLRLGRTTWPSFWCVFFGSLLFMLSDSVLAINRFLSPINHSTLIIMSTYCGAQFLIVRGILKHPRGTE